MTEFKNTVNVTENTRSFNKRATHLTADTYDIKPARGSLSRVNGLKEGRNNRTMFSKISLNLVIVGFCYHGNRQSICCTDCLKYAFKSLVCLLLVDMNCCEVILILCG